MWNYRTILKELEKGSRHELLIKGLHGLEKESLRITPEGKLAQTPHPKKLGDSFKNPYITTDFSESQLELITKATPTIEKTLAHLEELHITTWNGVKNELIWPMSMPSILPPHDQIPIARYGNSPEEQKAETYRMGLSLRYGRYMQTISGVHYNVSFHKEFWDELSRIVQNKTSKKTFINESSMQILRNFSRMRWLLTYLFGASPAKHKSYQCKNMDEVDISEAISLRQSRCGYSNPAKIHVGLNSFKEHLQDLRKAVSTPYPAFTAMGLKKNGKNLQLNDHILQIANEYYAPIRVKPPANYSDMLESLETTGVTYIEMRVFDLDPYTPVGVSSEQMYFGHMFLLYCLLKESPKTNEEETARGKRNQQLVAIRGQRKKLTLEYTKKEKKDMKDWAQEILKEMEPIAKLMDISYGKPHYQNLLEQFKKEIRSPMRLPWKKMIKEMDKKKVTFLDLGLEKARAYESYYTRPV